MRMVAQIDRPLPTSILVTYLVYARTNETLCDELGDDAGSVSIAWRSSFSRTVVRQQCE